MGSFQKTFRARSPLPAQGRKNGSPRNVLDRGRPIDSDGSHKSSPDKKSRKRDSSRRSRSPDRGSRSPVWKAQTFPQQSKKAAKATAEDTEAVSSSEGRESPLPTPVEQHEANQLALHSLTQPSSQGSPPTMDTALDDDNSLEHGLQQLTKAVADACHWWSAAYTASKHARGLRKPKTGSEYESQIAVYNAQLQEKEAVMKYANNRYAHAQQNTKTIFIDSLRHPEFRAITSNGFDPTKQKALEEKISRLEDVYKNIINDQDQRIAQLESRVIISSKSEEDQKRQISTINEEILELRELLEGVRAEIKQLNANYAAQKVEHEISQSATDATTRGIEAQLNKHIASMENRSQCLEAKMDEVVSNSWPSNNEKPLTRADLDPFAKKADLSELVSQADVAQLVSHADIAQLLSGLVSQQDISQLVSHRAIKDLVTRDELQGYVTSQGLQALESTVRNIIMTCATKEEIRGLASKEDICTIVATENFKSVAKAWEHGSSVVGQHNTDPYDGLGIVAARLRDAEASIEGLVSFQRVSAEHRLNSRVYALEETAMKKSELKGIGLDQLKDLSRRDFSTEIGEQVRMQVSRLPPSNPEVIIVEVKNRIQKELDSFQHLVNPLIEFERTRSEGLREEIIKALSAVRELETRMKKAESIPLTPTTAELREALNESIQLINDVNLSTTRSNASIKESINGLQLELRNTVQTFSEKQNSLHRFMTDEISQLALQHEHLQFWQQNFRTSAICAEIVAKMEEMVTAGTAARMRGIEDRLQYIERGLQPRIQNPNNQARGLLCYPPLPAISHGHS